MTEWSFIDKTTCVYCTFGFEGAHAWPDAISMAGVEFLALKHRHIFKVKVTVSVNHDDRDIEFILLKRYLQKVVIMWPKDLHNASCEMMAYCIGIATHGFINELTHDQLYFNFPFVRTPWKVDYEKKTPFLSSNSIEVEVSEDGENGARVCMKPVYYGHIKEEPETYKGAIRVNP